MPNQFIKATKKDPVKDGETHYEDLSVSWGQPSEFVCLELAHVSVNENQFVAASRETFDETTVTLTRRQVNELIRVLRKARDKAFGEDA